MNFGWKGQGGLEYLLLVGGAVLVAGIVIALISSIPANLSVTGSLDCLAKTSYSSCVAAGCRPLNSNSQIANQADFFICESGTASSSGMPAEEPGTSGTETTGEEPGTTPEGAGTTPDSTTPEETCMNGCDYAGQKQCSGYYAKTCGNFDADSCFEWGNLTQCKIGCEDEVCKLYSGTCTKEQAGEKRCIFFDENHGGPAEWTQECIVRGANQNGAWTNIEECPLGACQNGECVPATCANLERKCINKRTNACVDSEWIYENVGFCIIGCEDYCSSLNAWINLSVANNLNLANGLVEGEKENVDITIVLDKLVYGQVVFAREEISEVKVTVNDLTGTILKEFPATFSSVDELQQGKYYAVFDSQGFSPGEYAIRPVLVTTDGETITGMGFTFTIYRKVSSDKCTTIIAGTGDPNNKISLVFVGINQKSLAEFNEMISLILGTGDNTGLLKTEPFKSNESNFGIYYVTEFADVPNIQPSRFGYEADFESFSLASACEVPNKRIISLISNQITSSTFYESITYLRADYSWVFSSEGSKNAFIGTSIHETGHLIGTLEDEYIVADQGGLPDKILDFVSTKQCYGGGEKTLSFNDCVENSQWKSKIGDGCGENGIIDCIKYYLKFNPTLAQENENYTLSLDLNAFYPQGIISIKIRPNHESEDLMDCRQNSETYWACPKIILSASSLPELDIKTESENITNIKVEMELGVIYGEKIECIPKESKNCYVEVSCFIDGCTYSNQARSTYNSLMRDPDSEPRLFGPVNDSIICDKIFEITKTRIGVCKQGS